MNEFAVKDVRVNKNTVVDWYMFCRRGHSLDDDDFREFLRADFFLRSLLVQFLAEAALNPNEKQMATANSSIPRDANNSVLSASAKVFHPAVFDATNTDTGPNPPNVNNPSITSCSGFDSNSQVLLCTALVNVCDSFHGGTPVVSCSS
ncbi:hypothetical protein TNCV_2279961 [Trichonephila clavipes]|nr:hypothetical protein TNCV_2279961 [Trichonephila clavipes]